MQPNNMHIENKWFDNNIILVKQLLNADGFLLAYSEVLNKLGVPVTTKEHATVFDAIPQQILQLLKGSANVIGNHLFIGDTDILKYKCTNRYIRKVISNERIYIQPRWSFVFFGNINWNKTRTICDKYCMNNNIKVVTFTQYVLLKVSKRDLELLMNIPVPFVV